ncbi:CRISPR system Cascade subunit CasA [Desulfobaculum xiamenense]|uniref:CRISPR system Cascade subunit CasA n=1 Tax=Desulfobaculum xiamenense TaxID=995050 RepID=A0A846QTE3_9BACT|nr:type I-E CRISPR-associated protein Cse1/CasA [Desulfobaculum xiamenense]NJB67909.1 CRISPR system Cascade subunit CasA [Desulfobaculum xiamenense]
MFNLLEERWLPVIRADGTQGVIAPWEIAAGGSLPVALHVPRPDFRAAMMEFLVGLLQTVRPPARRKDWLAQLRQPPSPDELRQAMRPHVPFFELFGQRPLFLQDLTLEAPAKAKDFSDISALLIDSPGENTLKNNGDFFVKRGRVNALCPACAAMALFTMQAFAPAGGAGIRTSLRGGGPLSTMVDMVRDDGSASTLWEKLWLNVLCLQTRAASVQPAPTELAGVVYPWAAPTRTSEGGEQTHPEDVHWLQAYWGMPRRVVLVPEDAESGEVCDVCGAQSARMVRRMYARKGGTNYGPTWQHPLTPYRDQNDKPPLSIKGSANVTGYGHWLGVVYDQLTAKGIRRSANVAHVHESLNDALHLGVNVAGYDMDNMKARQWCESTFPVYPVAEDRLADFRGCIEMMVAAADKARMNLAGMLKEALVNEAGHKQASVDKTVFANAQAELWSRTEARFYELAKDAARSEGQKDEDRVKDAWRDHLCRTAQDIFHGLAESGRVLPERIRRVCDASRKLWAFNDKALRKILELPERGGAR